MACRHHMLFAMQPEHPREDCVGDDASKVDEELQGLHPDAPLVSQHRCPHGSVGLQPHSLVVEDRCLVVPDAGAPWDADADAKPWAKAQADAKCVKG